MVISLIKYKNYEHWSSGRNTMGNWFSSPNSESKEIEADGEVNNNVVIQGGSMDYGFEMMILNSIICAIKIFEIIVFLHKRHARMTRQNIERKLKDNSDKV